MSLRALFEGLLGRDERPVVAFAGLWRIMSAFPSKETAARDVLDALLEAVGPGRTLFMPTFTPGFHEGLIDLDTAPATTGLINEMLRNTPGALRSASAFFSFAGYGPQAREASALRPLDIWGDGSFYEWMERKDAHCLMIGVPRTNCSYLHRLEWLLRDRLPYRHRKEFSGQAILEGASFTLTERLFVRDAKTDPHNDWLPYEDRLEGRGMRCERLGRGLVSVIGTNDFRTALLPEIERDPFAFVRDADKLRRHYTEALHGE